jgi:8-oxo-dGTP pyrophosphatase MutT (NUDIX family)
MAWEDSYLGQLRAAAGEAVLLFVGSRCLIRDDAGRLLLIRRSDNLRWAVPAGAMELGETAAGCAAREAFEETGLRVTDLTPFALYSGPGQVFTNEWGHTYQLHVTAFRADAWDGDLLTTTDETVDARFFDLAELPEPVMGSVPEVVRDLARFEATGAFVLG